MEDIFERTRLIIGDEKLELLKSKRVALFGLGGVGSYASEALIRSGIGQLDFIDGNVFSLSNLNRQLYATLDTIGKKKVEIAKDRALSINKDLIIRTYDFNFTPQTSNLFNFNNYDYVIDAIDMVSGKLEIIEKARECNTPLISSMGTANRLDPLSLHLGDIYSTSVCPLAKVMRHECKKRGIKKLQVVWSDEIPKKEDGVRSLGSVSFVPAVAGLITSSVVIRSLIGLKL